MDIFELKYSLCVSPLCWEYLRPTTLWQMKVSRGPVIKMNKLLTRRAATGCTQGSLLPQGILFKQTAQSLADLPELGSDWMKEARLHKT